MQKIKYSHLVALLSIAFLSFSAGIWWDHHRGISHVLYPLAIGIFLFVLSLKLLSLWLAYKKRLQEKQLLEQANNPWFDPPEDSKTTTHFATQHTPFLRERSLVDEGSETKDHLGPTIWNRPKPGKGHRKR